MKRRLEIAAVNKVADQLGEALFVVRRHAGDRNRSPDDAVNLGGFPSRLWCHLRAVPVQRLHDPDARQHLRAVAFMATLLAADIRPARKS